MADGDSYFELLREIQELRSTVEELKKTVQSSHRIALTPVHTNPFLGQAVTVLVKVEDGAGNPAAPDIPVTFTTTWGRLRCADGYAVQEGKAITAQTNVDGTLRITLFPLTSQEIWDEQQEALESHLGLLDPHAMTPQATEAGLLEMARQYRWEANVQFRRAVDIYFRDFRESLLHTVNHKDHMARWSLIDATIMAHVHGQASGQTAGSSVSGTAACTLRFKDWLGPFLQTCLDLAQQENPLEDDLQWIKKWESKGGNLVGDVYGRIRDYVTAQRGAVGEYVGHKVSETALRDFLQSGINDLPLDTRLTLFPALQTASDTLVKTGVHVLSGLGQARSDLRAELSTEIGRIDAGSMGIGERISGLETRLGTKADRSAVDDALAGKLDAATFQGFRAEVKSSLGAKTDSTAFHQFRTQMGAELEGKVGNNTFDRFQADVNSSLAAKVDNTALERFRTDMQKALSAKVDTAFFQTFRDEMEGSLKGKVDNSTFEQFKTGVDTRLDRKVESSAFNRFQGNVNQALDAKANKGDLAEMQASLNRSLDAKLDTSDFTRFEREVLTALEKKADRSALSRFELNFNEALKSKVDATTFERYREETNTAIRNKLDASTFNGFRTDVSTRLARLRG